MKKLYSEYQSCYFAYWLTRHGLPEETILQTLANAKLDIIPHQIEAALFALQSPFSKGVLLADEVGLGKTIEACLVIAQRWAEKKQKVLLIVPACLRKQWEQELWDKFHLPSLILKKGIKNPFDQKKIIICSYEFAAQNDKFLQQITWDIVVFDEAHNAKKLNNTLSSNFKLLLSARPLQNSIDELYDLIYIIDANFLGDINSLKTIVYRTLRKDVQDIGNIKFTQRYSITQDYKKNRKGEALLLALPKAIEMNQKMGGNDKVVIFTESVQTQQYIKELLESEAYKDQLVLLNDNTPDMTAAIVDHFKHKAKILISTESGGEGINLQFCSIVINYDLPWNPQRIEQRIQRLHSYGQKNDVIVVNFINRDNRADCRMFELFKKFKLFDGVFGANDEILGTVANNIDIEKRIHDEYFNKLEEYFKQQLEISEKNTAKNILDNFTHNVNLSRWVVINNGLQKYQRMLKRLAQAESINIKDSLANNNVSLLQFHNKYQELPKEVYLDKFIGFKGYLQLNLLEIKSKKRRVEYLLVNVYSDNNDSLPENFGEELLLIPAKLGEKNVYFSPDVIKLEQLKEEKTKKYLAKVEADNEKWFDQEDIKLENWRKNQISDFQTSLEDLDTEIRLKKKDLRNSKEKIELRKEIRKLEKYRDNKMMEFYENKKDIDNQADKLLDDAEESLELSHKITTIFTIRWELLA
ncbi:DEAD/DEAH box helicase [Candidatus Marithrix sp. Canyon 246]|uniref:DEAD/DEAH box helicase n=1 Tax=Candidatus Marithrix sp. Canyon 246 TaxID=1827136 RepID=UPI00084A0369|nr:DEAD/DEAH box helicase [Candidatus Marithrix sp. Canyon 246]